MAYFSHSALSDLIHSKPLEHETSIEFLRLSHSKSRGTAIPEVHGIFRDEIVSFINAAGERPQLHGCQHPSLSQNPDDAACVQILFLSSFRVDGCTTNQLKVTASTLERLCSKLGVPLAFIDAVLNPSIWSKQSGASFHRHDAEGTLDAIDGFYHYFNEWDLGPLHVWFSYNLKSKTTTYMLFDCPENVKKNIISNANEPSHCFLTRPFAIDFLIAEQCALWRENFINEHYNQIFDWHDKNGSMNPPLKRHISTVENIQSLHQLSRLWNMLYEDLGDFSERLDFLLHTCDKLSYTPVKHVQNAIESFEFLQKRNHLRRRWVTSFGERTKLIIGFVFSVAGQNDAQTNLEIANLTTMIAEETQRDNSSMITIATMTMLFLPGTFISAIFSMVFFNYGVDGNGQEYFQVSTRLWMFFAVTIPLTILVSAIYQYWRRKRERRMKSKRMQKDAEKGEALGRLAETSRQRYGQQPWITMNGTDNEKSPGTLGIRV